MILKFRIYTSENANLRFWLLCSLSRLSLSGNFLLFTVTHVRLKIVQLKELL